MLHFFAFITAANCISVEMFLSAAYPWIALTDPENGVMDKGWGIGGYLKKSAYVIRYIACTVRLWADRFCLYLGTNEIPATLSSSVAALNGKPTERV